MDTQPENETNHKVDSFLRDDEVSYSAEDLKNFSEMQDFYSFRVKLILFFTIIMSLIFVSQFYFLISTPFNINFLLSTITSFAIMILCTWATVLNYLSSKTSIKYFIRNEKRFELDENQSIISFNDVIQDLKEKKLAIKDLKNKG